MKYLIHLVAPFDVTVRIVALRNQCGLGEPTLYPHVTLYTIYAKESDEKQMCSVLDAISFVSFEATLEGFDYFDEDSQVVRVKKERPILELHERVTDGLKSFVDWSDTKEYNGHEVFRKKIWRTYGSAYVAEGYNPHMTIGHGKGERQKGDTLEGVCFGVDRFMLAKKKEGIWSTVREFHANN